MSCREAGSCAHLHALVDETDRNDGQQHGRRHGADDDEGEAYVGGAHQEAAHNLPTAEAMSVGHNK